MRRFLGFVSLALIVVLSNLTEEEEEEEEEACHSCAAKRSVVSCFVCFLRSCFSCGGEKEFGEERELKMRELKPFLLCRVYAEICTYDRDIHVN